MSGLCIAFQLILGKDTGMKKSHLAALLAILLIALVAAVYANLPAKEVTIPLVEENKPEMKTYASSEHGLSFSYSPSYYLKERKDSPGSRPELSLVLVEDTQENRDVLEGRSSIPREGPTAITIEAYPNPDKLPAEDWVRASTNWTVRTSDAAPFGKGSVTGVTYSWSGLYEGKSYIVTEGDRAYVFSVTWMVPEDAILAEFDRILASTIIAPAAP